MTDKKNSAEKKEINSKARPQQTGGEEVRHIVRIVRVDIPGNKSVLYALKKIKGIGLSFSNALLSTLKIDKKKKLGLLTQQEIESIEGAIKDPAKHEIPIWAYNRRKDPLTNSTSHLTTGNFAYALDNDIKRLRRMKSYVGVRHASRLPVRGQRTKSNFRKSKGKGLGVKKKKG